MLKFDFHLLLRLTTFLIYILMSISSKVVVVNSNRVDFDKQIDWSILGPEVSVYYDEPMGTNPTDAEVIYCQCYLSNSIDVIDSLQKSMFGMLILCFPTSRYFKDVKVDAKFW